MLIHKMPNPTLKRDCAKARSPLASRSPFAERRENAGAEPVPLPSAPLRENQGHETDRSLRSRRLSPGIRCLRRKSIKYKHLQNLYPHTKACKSGGVL